jgi:hypothetical protein
MMTIVYSQEAMIRIEAKYPKVFRVFANESGERFYTWHASEKLPSELWNHARDAIEIQVDGHELEALKELFPSLPMPNKTIARFFGDTAKLIAGNLQYGWLHAPIGYPKRVTTMKLIEHVYDAITNTSTEKVIFSGAPSKVEKLMEAARRKEANKVLREPGTNVYKAYLKKD